MYQELSTPYYVPGAQHTLYSIHNSLLGVALLVCLLVEMRQLRPSEVKAQG